jgi:hypothetical protein
MSGLEGSVKVHVGNVEIHVTLHGGSDRERAVASRAVLGISEALASMVADAVEAAKREPQAAIPVAEAAAAGAPARHQWHQCGTPVAAVPVLRHQPPQQAAASTQILHGQASDPVQWHQPMQPPTPTVQRPQWQAQAGQPANIPPRLPPYYGDPSIFEWAHSAAWWRCRMCRKIVTDDHLDSDRHQNNLVYRAHYGEW